MKKLISTLLIITIFTTSCASFRSSNNPPISSFPDVSQNNKKSITIDVSFKKFLNDDPVYFMNEDGRAYLEDNMIKRFNSSDMFSKVNNSKKIANPDYKLEIDIVDKGDGSMIMAFLTGLTLYVIPSCATDEYEISAKLINTKTGKVNDIKMTDSVTMCQQLFLVFVMPFKFPVSVANKMHEDIADNLALKIQNIINTEK